MSTTKAVEDARQFAKCIEGLWQLLEKGPHAHPHYTNASLALQKARDEMVAFVHLMEPAQPEKCSMCGDPIGEGKPKNVVWFCDRMTNHAWCGECFDKTDCGKGEHGEGCETQMVCT